MPPPPHSSLAHRFLLCGYEGKSKRESLPSHPPELTVWGQPVVAKRQVKNGFTFNVFMVSHS